MIALYPIAYLYAFWLAYIVVMGAYRAHLAKRLSLIATILLSPVIAVGILMDVVANLTIACVIFMDGPEEWLVTTRLIRYKKQEQRDWRSEFAEGICNNLLDVFDPAGVHCA